jgi:hypothetical protein
MLITRLGPKEILNRIGRHALLAPAPRSWFIQVLRSTAQYGLPNPLLALQSTLLKGCWKSLCCSHGILLWNEEGNTRDWLRETQYFPIHSTIVTFYLILKDEQ